MGYLIYNFRYISLSKPLWFTTKRDIKSNTGLAKSPARIVRTQSNHIFMSLYTGAKLGCLSIKNGLNAFALKRKLYLKALRLAFDELQILKLATA